jgi:hypothetical protein
MKILIISILLFPFCVYSQTEQLSINDSLLWTVIKYIIVKDSIPVVFKENTHYEILQSNTELLKEKSAKELQQHFHFMQGRCNEKITLSKIDLKSIDKQLAAHKVYNLDTTEIKLFLRTKQHVKRYNQHYYSISTPVFFNNCKMAYVRIEYNCTLCGQGTGYILKKTNNGWTIYCILDEWIS